MNGAQIGQIDRRLNEGQEPSHVEVRAMIAELRRLRVAVRVMREALDEATHDEKTGMDWCPVCEYDGEHEPECPVWLAIRASNDLAADLAS
jgi:hypothetical protein